MTTHSTSSLTRWRRLFFSIACAILSLLPNCGRIQRRREAFRWVAVISLQYRKKQGYEIPQGNTPEEHLEGLAKVCLYL